MTFINGGVSETPEVGRGEADSLIPAMSACTGLFSLRLERLYRVLRPDLEALPELLLREAILLFLLELEVLVWVFWVFESEIFFFWPLVGTDWAIPGDKIKARVNNEAIISLFAIQNLLGWGTILKGTEPP